MSCSRTREGSETEDGAEVTIADRITETGPNLIGPSKEGYSLNKALRPGGLVNQKFISRLRWMMLPFAPTGIGYAV